jgi:predicted DNA-binding transcriptional regulator YafY
MQSMRIRLCRCLRLLDILQSRIGYKISYLAREFEVSRRTIYRDIRFLEQAGIPIRYDSEKGGHALQRHFKLCVSKFSDDELSALLLAAHVFALSCGRDVSHPVHQAISKLLAQLPMSLCENMGNLLSSIRGVPSSALWPEKPHAVVGKILSAISQKQQIRIVYIPPEETATPVRTKITPECLMASDGRWYLVGRSSWHRKVRRFDLEHIQVAEQVADSTSEPSPPAHHRTPELAEHGYTSPHAPVFSTICRPSAHAVCAKHKTIAATLPTLQSNALPSANG